MANLKAAYNWNRNVTIITDDYAANGNTSVSQANITIGTGVVGKTAIFNGASSTIKFGDVNDVGGINQFAFLFQIKRASSKLQYLSFKEDNAFVRLNADNTVRFQIEVGGGPTFIDSIGTIDTSSRTIECVYDGVGAVGFMGIYIDGVLDNSKAQAGNAVASANDFLLGHQDSAGDADFFDGEMEAVDIRTDLLLAKDVLAWHKNPLGIKYTFETEHNLLIGDVTAAGDIFSGALPEKAGSVAFVDDDFTFRYKPIQDKLNLNDVPVRRANIFDGDRQFISEYNMVGGFPIFQIKDRIKTLADSLSSAEALKGVLLTKDASIFKNALVMDFTIEPPEESGAINNFAPTDLEFATTMYISSTNPVNWNGLLAPVPVRPQLIFVINSGSKNITAKNNASASDPENRFLINANVAFQPEQMGFVLYDVARSRWRVNKI